MKLEDLKPNPANPRKITDVKLEMLRKSIAEFGDLSGVIFNRATGQLLGGHQRLKVLPPDAEIVRHELSEPSPTGTVATGHIMINGERFNYREVSWDENREKAANIAANQHGGEWDYPLLTDWVNDLDAANIDIDLLGFDHGELTRMLAPDFKIKAEEPELKEPESVECPSCGEIFKP